MNKYIMIILFCLVGLRTDAQTPSWSVTPIDYQYTATLTGAIKFNDTIISSGNNLLGAFVDDELRGVVSPTDVGGDDLYFITIYSNNAVGEKVDFKIYLEMEDSIYDVYDSIEFTSNAAFGTPEDPVGLHLFQDPFFNVIANNIVETGIEFSGLALKENITNYARYELVFSIIDTGETYSALISNDSLFVSHDYIVTTDSVLVGMYDAFQPSVLYDSAYVVFQVRLPNAIKEIESDHKFKIYPNPNNGQFKVEIDKMISIEVVNILGEIVYEEKVNGNSKKFDLALVNGMYFVNVTTEEKKTTINILVR